MYSPGDDISPDQAKRFAIEKAKEGRGYTSPNPLVGCVIVDKDHKFLSAGAHLRYGEAHAEVNAILNVEGKSQLQDATVYVTLEPCSHYGKTGPCAEALAKIPIKKVIYGMVDPNPKVSGKGIEILKVHKKQVEAFGQYERECAELCEQHVFHSESRQPFVAIKAGVSFDGKIALKNGESQWITGEEARLQSRKMRAFYDATMIGEGTLRHDNPSLDFRDTEFAGKKENKIIILDPKGKGAENFKGSNLAEKHNVKNIFVLTRAEYAGQWSKNLVHVVQWEASEAGWRQALKNLYNKGVYSIYAEGGSYVFGQLLNYKLAQKLYLFQSNKVLGEGVSWSQFLQIDKIDKAPELKNLSSVAIGQDCLTVGYF